MKKVKIFLALLSVAVLIYGATQTEFSRQKLEMTRSDLNIEACDAIH